MSLALQINNLAQAVGNAVKDARARIGTLANLTTTTKTDLVSAVNEVNGKVGTAGAQIDDTGPSASKVYSSQKTDSQIGTASTADRSRANHTGTQTASTISDFSAAADARIANAQGAANGVAPLDANKLVPAAFLPSFVDDVLEFSNLAAMPNPGETGKIYVALDTNKEFRWSGSTYIEISASPGSTDAVPEGATNQYFTAARATAAVQAQLDAKLAKANNLSDLADASAARNNLSVYSQAQIGDPETNFTTTFNTALTS